LGVGVDEGVGVGEGLIALGEAADGLELAPVVGSASPVLQPVTAATARPEEAYRN